MYSVCQRCCSCRWVCSQQRLSAAGKKGFKESPSLLLLLSKFGLFREEEKEAMNNGMNIARW